jgi:uncharacterized repeat protein (TIGR03833 family)
MLFQIKSRTNNEQQKSIRHKTRHPGSGCSETGSAHRQTDGRTVKDILPKSHTHPHGIKVRLTDGIVGRVKEVLEELQ